MLFYEGFTHKVCSVCVLVFEHVLTGKVLVSKLQFLGYSVFLVDLELVLAGMV